MYNSAKHKVFSKRIRDLMQSIQNCAEEVARLDSIYINESVSGADAAFVDTEIATKQEHIDAIVFCRAFSDFVDGGAAVPQLDRRSNVTPFLQRDD